VHSFDVAEALEVMMDADLTSTGKTFSLAGPKTYTVTELLRLVESLTFKKAVREGLNIPKFALMAAAKIGDLAWWPMLAPDEVTRRYIDDKADEPGETLSSFVRFCRSATRLTVLLYPYHAGTLGFADLGIEPDLIEERASVYLRRYRTSLRFEQPVENSGVKLKKSKYHVID
jgi:NADH dehydrogenase (ubiquinone) 1 alpha subcomplex subunit 9